MLKKVCHLSSVHRPDDTRIFVKECSTLAEAGYEVHLLTAIKAVEHGNGVIYHSIEGTFTSRRSRMTKIVWKVYKKALDIDADIYHFHDPELMIVGLLLKKKGKKVIYDVHEDLPRQILSKYWIPILIRKPVSMLCELLEQYAARKFDAIVTVTTTISARFLNYNKNTKTIQNFPLLNELWSAEENSQTSDKLPTGVYLGVIAEIRGIQEMILAIDNVNQKGHDIQLSLAGNFATQELENSMRTLHEWQCVDYLGMLERNEVKKLFSRSLFGFVLFYPEPNHINAQPNKLFEYMSAGIPVIASDFPMWKDLIEEDNVGLCVDPMNIIEIADAITYLLTHPEEARQMGVNGRTAIEEKYNWQIESSKLKELYHHLS